MKRRHLLLAMLTVIAPPTAFAKVPQGMDELKPYLQVKPVAGDEETVRVFFSPACPFSRSYFQFFKNLEATLPAGKAFIFTPLVNKGDGLEFALSFLAVQKYYPAYVHNFMEASFIGVQDKSIATRNWAGIDRIGQAAHVPVSVPLLVHQHADALRVNLETLLVTQKGLEVTNTPAVTVAGTYIVTPEFTQGDAQMFSQLVNGIISMAR
ncbi:MULTISPECIES: thiol-disulfide isomerase [Paraburkholderia]|uniref:Thiol-disulfide isomerase n=1 Tax=Paraburkholderia madseniana TaxID=2599607 RepID=A0AAP5ET92_9BURK|nr:MULTISPECIES: thiol-disulfide isomerase [Paraburkholderia]MCX4151025.1 thiol-disulfide isomerase [Paraburkholderia madseniana]MCX4176665.1 thiol-disulfide isomerase [Paraburkholderia madseniana]MDN7153957.1 thiol-disulfide isomerase [Paraburkholderia sp. WS6]MDQ6412839.1 thiol-disulfide isomerase [Paraburkholderia madseniana]MDQ6464656.1 thiol-disulfide isomerase [Paraburkholderia madseniana]